MTVTGGTAQTASPIQSATANSNAEVPGCLHFSSSGRPLALRLLPLVIGLQEAKQQETSAPRFEGTQHLAVRCISAFLPDPGCQQPFLLCLGCGPCA